MDTNDIQYQKRIMVYNNRMTFLHRYLVFQAVIATYLLRPFALGAEYPVIGLILLSISSFLLAITLPHDNKGISSNAIILLSFYLIDTIIILATGTGGETAYTKFGYVVLGAILFSNKLVTRLFFRYFKSTVLLLIICSIITYILEFFIPEQQLLIKDFNAGTYEFSLYYPLSLTSSKWNIESAAVSLLTGTHIRNNYFFIEPGMVPPFFSALIFLIYDSSTEKHKGFQITLLLIGILLTFSTAGPLILLSSCGVYYFLRSYQNKRLSLKTFIIVLIMIFFAYYAFEYMPSFGRQAKMGLSNAQAESMETHQQVLLYVIIGVAINAICAIFCSFKKSNYALYLTMAWGLCVGYLSNYIAFTLVFSLFLLWGDNKVHKNQLISGNIINT